MSKRTAQYHSNARFFDLGAAGAPFRAAFNIDQLAHFRFEQQIEQDEDGERMLVGWQIVLQFNNGEKQSIGFPDEAQAVDCYNAIVEKIVTCGVPHAFSARLEAAPPLPEESQIIMPNGGGVTDEDVDALANPEIDEEAIADAFDTAEDAPNDGKH